MLELTKKKLRVRGNLSRKNFEKNLFEDFFMIKALKLKSLIYKLKEKEKKFYNLGGIKK